MEISLHTYGDRASVNTTFIMQNNSDMHMNHDIVQTPPLAMSSSPHPSLPALEEARIPVNKCLETNSVPSVHLLDTELWNSFNRAVNEMIVTRDGRRLFPVFKARVSGLDPNQMYKFELDFQLVDSYRWKYVNCEWLRSTRCDVLSNSRVYTHPDSPNYGRFWMDSSVSFSRIKITNRENSSLSKIFLHSMYKYIPRFLIKLIDDSGNESLVGKYSFNETEFIAVTAYQNEAVTQLKVRHNPFAKAFQEPRRTERSDRQDSLPRHHLLRKADLSNGIVCCDFSRVRVDSDRYGIPSSPPFYIQNSVDPFRRISTDIAAFDPNTIAFGHPTIHANFQPLYPSNGYLNTFNQRLSPNGLCPALHALGNLVLDNPYPRYTGAHSLSIDPNTPFHDGLAFNEDSRISSLSVLAAIASQQSPPELDDKAQATTQTDT